MELINTIEQQKQVINDNIVIKKRSPIIQANTIPVTMDHLKNDCIIPVFSRDNETTISHHQFIEKTIGVVQDIFPNISLSQPEIRVSHIVKGRVPNAIGKPAKELLDNEKTIYYERCAFTIDLPQITEIVNGNELNLTIGGVRSLSHENLYSKKSLEKFKVFIGFKNIVCTNLCVSTDGCASDIRVGSINELGDSIQSLLNQWDSDKQLGTMEKMSKFEVSGDEFAHIVGKLKMYHYLGKEEQRGIFPNAINDNQINVIIKDYFNCKDFSRHEDGSLNLWRFYNLITGANKSSYIDSFLDRGLFAYGFVKDLCNSIQNQTPNWYLNN